MENQTEQQKENLKNAALDFASTVFGIGYRDDIRNIPENTSGDFQVKDDVNIDGKYIYQNLYRQGRVIATNDPKELHAHRLFLESAEGHVLISGLGLGNSLHEALKKKAVESVTVVESGQDIITLTAPSFKNEIDAGKVAVVHADIHNYTPSTHYDCIYHAIWGDEKSTRAAVKERKALKARFSPFCTWQGFIYLSPRGGYRPGARRPTGTNRPIKPGDQIRCIQKAVRYKASEFEVVKNAAELAGKTVSDIMLAGSLKEAARIIYKIDDSSLDELIRKIVA